MDQPRLRSWFEDHVSFLATRVVDEFARQVPFYAMQPAEVMEGKVRLAVEANLHSVLRTFPERRPLTAEERTEVITWSARRAAEGAPLEAVLAAYHLGMEVCWQEVSQVAGAGDTEELALVGAHIFGYLRAVIPAVTLAHVHERQTRHGEQQEARRAMYTALLAGEPAWELTVQSGVAVAPCYVVVVLRLTEPPWCGLPVDDETRQITRRIRAALDGHAQTHVLAALDASGGTVLLPAGQGTLQRQLDEVGDLVDAIRSSVRRRVTAAVAAASTVAEIPAAAAEATEITMVVERLGSPPGVYRLEDVLLEYQLARPGHGLAKLAAKLDAIADRPDLMDTLRALVVHGHNRLRAAQDLHVHRNTLDYRLRRIAKLTGLDPAAPDGGRILSAALTARTLIG